MNHWSVHYQLLMVDNLRNGVDRQLQTPSRETRRLSQHHLPNSATVQITTVKNLAQFQQPSFLTASCQDSKLQDPPRKTKTKFQRTEQEQLIRMNQHQLWLWPRLRTKSNLVPIIHVPRSNMGWVGCIPNIHKCKCTRHKCIRRKFICIKCIRHKCTRIKCISCLPSVTLAMV